jgi:hypothetical protein
MNFKIAVLAFLVALALAIPRSVAPVTGSGSSSGPGCGYGSGSGSGFGSGTGKCCPSAFSGSNCETCVNTQICPIDLTDCSVGQAFINRITTSQAVGTIVAGPSYTFTTATFGSDFAYLSVSYGLPVVSATLFAANVNLKIKTDLGVVVYTFNMNSQLQTSWRFPVALGDHVNAYTVEVGLYSNQVAAYPVSDPAQIGITNLHVTLCEKL